MSRQGYPRSPESAGPDTLATMVLLFSLFIAALVAIYRWWRYGEW